MIRRLCGIVTLKPEMVLVNCDGGLTDPLPADLLALAPTARKVAPKLEMELRELSEEEQKEIGDNGELGVDKDTQRVLELEERVD